MLPCGARQRQRQRRSSCPPRGRRSAVTPRSGTFAQAAGSANEPRSEAKGRRGEARSEFTGAGRGRAMPRVLRRRRAWRLADAVRERDRRRQSRRISGEAIGLKRVRPVHAGAESAERMQAAWCHKCKDAERVQGRVSGSGRMAGRQCAGRQRVAVGRRKRRRPVVGA